MIQRKALADAQAIEDESGRAETLIGLARYLPKELLEEALATARAIEDEWNRAEVLIGLAPYLPMELLERMVREIRQRPAAHKTT